MGKFVNGIHGPFIGKVGNVIGSSWRGIHYMKSRGLRTKPATEGEKLNRFIFGMTQQWLNPLTAFLRVGFKNYTPTNQGINAAKSYLYKNALIKNGYDSVIDPTLVKVSHGALPFPDRMEVELNSDNELVFTWDTKCKNDEEFDQVILLAYDIDEKDAMMSLNGKFRETGWDVLDINGLKNFVVYAAFVSSDRTSQSDSVYLGEFTDVEIFDRDKWMAIQDRKKDRNKPVSSSGTAPTVITEESGEIEEVDPNQLSLFDSLIEVSENKTEPLKSEAHVTENQVNDEKSSVLPVQEDPASSKSQEAINQPEEDTSHPNKQVEAETQAIVDQSPPEEKSSDNAALTEVKDNVKQESPDKPALIKSKDTEIQKFTYVNPNVEVENKIPDSPDIKKEEDERIVIKKDRTTYYTTKKHLRMSNIRGDSDLLKD